MVTWCISDAEAQRQLGLSEDYSIFLMSVSITYINSYEEALGVAKDDYSSLLCVDDAISRLQESEIEVQLPKGTVLVGLNAPQKKDVYGLVSIPEKS